MLKRNLALAAMSLVAASITVAGQAGPAAQQQAPASQTAMGRSVRLQKFPATWALVRDVKGSYGRHEVVFREMMQYVGENYRALGDCFGIYPMDPDAVKQGELSWQVGVRIVSGKPLGFGERVEFSDGAMRAAMNLKADRRKLKAPAAPYRIVLLEAAEAAVVESTVADSAKDGLAMFRWMAENARVQVVPTRMEYLSHEGAPNQIKTRIIVPVEKRASGLSVPAGQ